MTWFEDVTPGDRLPDLVKTCTPRQLVMWAGAAEDYYEIHYDADAAHAAGLPGRVVHGALKNAFLGQLVRSFAGPGGRVVRFGCSYRGLDVPGEPLRCRGVVRATSVVDGEHRADLEIWIENPRGEVTTPGTAVVALPTRRRRGPT